MKKDKFFVHSSSFVDKNADIGSSTKIWHFCHIMSGAKIGKNCTLGQNVFIGENVVIGNNVKLQNNVSVFEGVELEAGVFCGPGVTFTNVKMPRAFRSANKKYDKTKVGKGATVGANSTIICGTTVGKYAFIGAGSVVTHDAPDYGLVFGNPAKLHGFICQCGRKLEFKKNKKALCPNCQKKYILQKDSVRKTACHVVFPNANTRRAGQENFTLWKRKS